jgi:hypothetical protein
VKKSLKRGLLNQVWFQEAWGAYRSWQLKREYVARREHYAHLAHERKLVYRESDIISALRGRLKGRGYIPTPRRMGEVHTFTFIPHIGWHTALIPDLRELGPVSEFDYVAYGYQPEEFRRRDNRAAQRRREMNDMVLPALRAAHARQPVDWVFIYASGLEVRGEMVRSIVEELGVPVVNMCLDDKQSWDGPILDGQHLGQIDIAPFFDLSWTSARVVCEWYLVEDGRPTYMPEGFDMNTYRPMAVGQDIPVSFIGGAYGYRPSVVRYLRRHGVPLQTFGEGWPDFGWVKDVVEIINRSIINLGMGGIGYLETLTNVKGRDFEIPGTGGGVYLTSFNPDLAQHFIIGEEILCYRNREEMLELIRYYLAHPDDAGAIARRGRERCLREHRWLHRYERVCKMIGILKNEEQSEENHGTLLSQGG